MMRALFIVTICLGLMPDAALAAGDIVAGENSYSAPEEQSIAILP